MKTKHYEFTEYEMSAIKLALIDLKFYYIDNKVVPKSPIAIKIRNSIQPLIEQFTDDIRLI